MVLRELQQTQLDREADMLASGRIRYTTNRDKLLARNVAII